MKKKLFVLGLIVVLAMSLSACGTNETVKHLDPGGVKPPPAMFIGGVK